ncbi:Hpt domain-containing protein [Actinoplanes sp. NPDC023936]|uniref:Hpt domain-containing protein n=1 Tax=Actinoplanes sp. NPDC023936 TaxID=3154910 RepID=UPI0033E024D8
MGASRPADHDARVAAVRARLDDVTGGEPGPDELDLLIRLLRAFAARAPELAGQLIDLLAADDLGQLRDLAHALKGSAANVGAAGLSALCAGVEQDARAGVRPEPASTARRLRTEVTAAQRAVTEVADGYAKRRAG